LSQVEQQIKSMVVAIFVNRQMEERAIATKEAASTHADLAKRGLSMSGGHARLIMQTYESAEIRTIEKTIEELSLQFRLAGRKDARLFWNIIKPELRELAIAFNRSNQQTVNQKLQLIGAANLIGQATQTFAKVEQLLNARVHEFQLKSQFMVLKTPEDRRANGIPDVAVMMWFPDSAQPPNVKQAAQDRYNKIKEAVSEASNGLATVNKFDDPGIAPQDRISASIETWLEKAVLVICDLAGQRRNVYYEFGYTRAVGTDVLLTCPGAEISEITLHLGQWQRVEYDNPGELKSNLVEKTRNILSKYDLSGSL